MSNRMMDHLEYISNAIDPVPLNFTSEEEFYEYVGHVDYETDEDRPGICGAVLVKENISNNSTKFEDQEIKVEIFAEGQRGKTPAAAMAGLATSQQTIPNTGVPSFDRYSKNPNARSCEMYVRQGYSWVHNWAANAALR